MVTFEGDEKRQRCDLKTLLEHDLKITVAAGWADTTPLYTPPKRKGKAPADAPDSNRTQSYGDVESGDTDSSEEEYLASGGETRPCPVCACLKSDCPAARLCVFAHLTACSRFRSGSC